MDIFDKRPFRKESHRELWKKLYNNLDIYPERTYRHFIESRLVWKLRQNLNKDENI